MGDFNVDKNDESLKEFCQFYKLKHLIKVPTETQIIPQLHISCEETLSAKRLSDFHKMTVIVLKIYLKSIPMIFFSNLHLMNLLKYRYVMKYQLYKLIWMFV